MIEKLNEDDIILMLSVLNRIKNSNFVYYDFDDKYSISELRTKLHDIYYDIDSKYSKH